MKLLTILAMVCLTAAVLFASEQTHREEPPATLCPVCGKRGVAIDFDVCLGGYSKHGNPPPCDVIYRAYLCPKGNLFAVPE